MNKRWLQVSLGLFLGLLLTDGLCTVMRAQSQSLDSYTVYYVAPGRDCGPSVQPCFATIQAAVDAADAPGDLIKVSQGTYTGVHARQAPAGYLHPPFNNLIYQVVYIDKSVSVQGGYSTLDWATPNPETNPTVVDAQSEGRGLVIAGNISPTIAGLRITGGDAAGLGGGEWQDMVEDSGGGSYVLSATATITNSWVYSNFAASGGGFYLAHSQATVSQNSIVSNTGSFDAGGLYAHSSSMVVNGNLISDNTAPDGGGGGLLSYDSEMRITNNTIQYNKSWEAGGLFLMGCQTCQISHNTIISNLGFEGGGIGLIYSSTATINDNLIAYNRAVGGGGISMHTAEVTLTNNVVVSNHANSGGGLTLSRSNVQSINNVVSNNQSCQGWPSCAGNGVFVVGSVFRAINTTFANNGGGSSGIYVDVDWEGDYSTIGLTNTILVSHTVGISATSFNTVSVNSILWNNELNSGGAGIYTVANTFSGTAAFAADGYHLTAASDAIDHGVPTDFTTDIDGQPRPLGAGFDLGADEYDFGWGVFDLYLTLSPDQTGTLVYTNSQGLTTTIQVPAPSHTTTLTFHDLSRDQLAPSELAFANHAFHLAAYQHGDSLRSSQVVSPLLPLTVTVEYSDHDLRVITDEAQLGLLHWQDPSWQDPASACSQSAYTRDLENNLISIPLCQLGTYALQGPTNRLWMPSVLQNTPALSCEEFLTKQKVWQGGLSWTCDSSIKHDGIVSLKLQADTDSIVEMYSQLIPVQPNQVYQVSYWVNADLEIDGAELYGRVLAAQYNSQAQESDEVNENRIDPGFDLGENSGLQQDWVHKSYTFTTDASTAYVRLRGILGGPEGTARGTMWLDNVALHKQ